MEVDLLLCDHAEALNGKLYIHGGGWSILYAANRPATMYLAMIVTFDWNDTNIRHEFLAELLTADGDPVSMPGDPPVPVRAHAGMEVGRPPGVKPGTSLPAPITFGVGGLVLDVGQYVWHVTVDGRELARKVFEVVAPPQLPGFPPIQ